MSKIESNSVNELIEAAKLAESSAEVALLLNKAVQILRDRTATAYHVLKGMEDYDWHGKWRVQKAIAALDFTKYGW